FKGSRISAIARNERPFVRRYGVMERTIVRSCRGEADDFSGRVHRGACGRRRTYKTERPRPGISPDLFNHFLLDRAVFMSLDELVCAELKAGRRCAIYPSFTGVHDVRPKLLKLLTDAGVRAVILPDTVRPEAREDWIARQVNEMDVLISHPKRVMTGLDLIQF